MSFLDEKDDIYPILMNTQDNKDYLSRSLHKEISDELTLVYELRPQNGITMPVTETMRKYWNVSVEDIHEAAMKNCIEEATYINAFDTAAFRDGSPGESLMSAISQEKTLPGVFIISNEDDKGGASVLLADAVFNSIAGINECNLIIVPTSKDEIIVFKSADTIIPERVESLNEMLKEINATHVHSEDKISEQIYVFDKDMGEVISFNEYTDRFKGIAENLPHIYS